MRAMAAWAGGRATARRRLPWALLALTASASVALALVSRNTTTYGGRDLLDRALTTGALGGLAAAALACRRRRPALAALAGVVALAWAAPEWVGWADGGTLARSVGLVLVPFMPALLLHLAAAWPSGRTARPWCVPLAAAYAVTLGYSVVRALFRDPFLDPDCWDDCVGNVLVVHPAPAFSAVLDTVWAGAVVVLGVLAAAVAASRLRAVGAGPRRQLQLVPAAVAVAASGVAFRAAAVLSGGPERPGRSLSEAAFRTEAIGLVAVAVALGWAAARDAGARRALARLAGDLAAGPRPGTLRRSLAAALGDPALGVVYRSATTGGWVDADGRTVPAPGGGGRVAVPIADGDRVVAVVGAGTAAAVDGVRLGPSARLAVENERLRVEVLAQVEQLRASCARIVQASDAERRRLERDLHDGAQQGLLAVSLDLQRARAAALAAGDQDRAAVLGAACDDVGTAFTELRALSHGVHPAILSAAGLVPALESLADTSGVPVRLQADLPARVPAAVEAAVHALVTDAVEAAARGDGELEVDLRQDGPAVHVLVGPLVAPPARVVLDRVLAVGGRAETGDGWVRAVLPCG